jgi:cation:H+ antiporter
VTVWLGFFVCTGVILFSGAQLSRYGDALAEKTGLGGTWVGVVLMASITSLPELITGASSMLLFDVPDIAAGDAIGSCMFNLLLLALLDISHHEPLSTRIHQGHVLSAAYGVVLLGLVTLGVLSGERLPVLGWVSVMSVAFIGVYLLAVRTIFDFERRRLATLVSEVAETLQYGGWSARYVMAMYALNAVVLIGAAAFLPGLADHIAEQSGLGQSFVGTTLVAMSTSLPELVVSVAAARIGAIDMAAANLFGSNLFNVSILGIDDVLYTKGPLLSNVSGNHTIAAVAAMTMTGVALIGLTVRATRKRWRLSWDSFAIVAIYGLATMMLFWATR